MVTVKELSAMVTVRVINNGGRVIRKGDCENYQQW